MKRWQERHRVGWDAIDGLHGGALRTAGDKLFEMEWLDCRAGEMDQGAPSLVLDLTNVFESVSLSVVWARATHFNSAQEDFAGLTRLLRAPAAAIN